MNKQAIKTLIIIVLILAVAAGIAITLKLMKKPPPEKSGELLRSLIAVPLKSEDIIPKVEEFALVDSLEDIAIKSQVNGKVVFCGSGTEDGVLVKKNEILVQIEKKDYEIAKQEAEAELEILRADAKQMTRNIIDLKEMLSTMKKDYELEENSYKRSKSLYEKNVYSKNDVERAQQAMSRKKKIYIEAGNALSKQKFMLEATKAKIKRADSKLDQAKLNLERTSIRTPIDGRVNQCDVEIGEYLNIGEQVCRVINDSKPSLKVNVNADDAIKILNIEPDNKFWLKTPESIKVSVFWMKKPELCLWSGKIARIENYDRSTDTLRVLVIPEKYKGTGSTPFPMLPGMFCKVIFHGKTIKNAFRIPFSALQFNDNVYTVDKTGVLHRHKVKPFSVEGDKVIILSGLPENESLVIQQLPRGVTDGMKVKPVIKE